MLVHEQIYTSAARLLEGGGNLGVVAESRGFPRQLAQSLAPFRGYTMLPRYSGSDPTAHPHRLVIGPLADGKSFAITRTVFAGADHTGRTTPLAHHVVFETADLRQSRRGIAELMRAVWPMLVVAWPDPPRWIDPPHEIVWASELPKPRLTGAWAAVLPWVADRMITFAQTGRSSVVVIDPHTANDICDHVVSALVLLPLSVQWSVGVATHVVSVSDYVRDAALFFTYPQTPFLEQCRQRRDSKAPLIFDLTADPKPPSAGLGPWGALIARDDSSTHDRTREWCRKFDEWSVSPNDISAFCAAAKLMDDLRAAPGEATSAQWQALGSRFVLGTSNVALAAAVEDAGAAAVRTLAADENSATRWETLSVVAADPRWTASARHAAVRAIFSGGNDALDAFASQKPTKNHDVWMVYHKELAARTDVVRQALSEAIACATPIALSRAASLLSLSTLSASEAAEATRTVINSAPPVKTALERPLLQALEHALTKPADIIRLYDMQSLGTNQQRRIGRVFVLPLLQKAIDRTQDTSWHGLVERYRDISIASGFVEEDFEWLFRQHSQMLSWTDAEAWINDSRLTEPQRQQIRRAANRAGKCEPQPQTSILVDPVSPAVLTIESDVPRARSQASPGVGPVRAGLYLAALVVIAIIGSSVIIHSEWRPEPTDRVLLMAASVTVGLWMAIEIALRIFFRSPRQFAFVRWSRRVSVLLLLAALVAAAWPIGRPAYSRLKDLMNVIHSKPKT